MSAQLRTDLTHVRRQGSLVGITCSRQGGQAARQYYGTATTHLVRGALAHHLASVYNDEASGA